MATLAGQMTQSPSGNPEWMLADGKPHSVLYNPKVSGSYILPRPATGILGGTGYRRDYARRVGWQARRLGLGPLGWIIQMPRDPGGTWYVKLEDDSADTALVANVTTTTTASTAAGQTVIPVTSATGFVVGLPIAATGIAAGASIAAINGLNITLSAATTGTVASGATVTVTPPGPPTAAKPPAGVK